MNKLKKLLWGCAMSFALLPLTACGSTTIDLNKYVTIEAEGYDSMGTLRYDFDHDKFEKDCDGKIKANVKSNDGGTAAEIALELGFGATVPETLLRYCVDYRVNKSSELSNGDKVTLKWNCEDEDAKKYFNCKLKYSDIEYTVKGLDEVPSFDPFEYVKVEFSGVSPQGFVEITPDYNKPEMQYLTFRTDKSGELSNGDRITVTVDMQESIDSFAQQFGALPNPLSKEFTVEGLMSYVTSSAEIDQDTLDAMKQQTSDIYVSKKIWDLNVDVPEYLGHYFMNKKEGMGGIQNYIYIIYKCDFEWEGKSYTSYHYGRFEELTLRENGKCYVDLSKCELPNHKYLIEPDSGFFSPWVGSAYGSIDELYEDAIVPQIASYTYENNVNN